MAFILLKIGVQFLQIEEPCVKTNRGNGYEKSGQHSLLQIRVDLLDFEAPTKSVIKNPFITRINKTLKQ